MSTDPSLVPPGTLPTTFIQTTGTSAGSVGYMVMSYPGRPPMVPGILPPTMSMPYMPIGAPPPLMPGVMPMGPMMGGPPLPPMPAQIGRPFRPATVSAAPKPARPPLSVTGTSSNVGASSGGSRSTVVPDGPVVTVFVGNITEKAPDQMIRFILSACGHVTSWKRVQAFGFCEYGNPDAGLRAIRILHNYDVGGKKLVVKVDAKTKTILDDYKNDKRKKGRSGSPLQDEAADEDDYMDEEMKAADKAALERISMILSDYDSEMKSYVPPQNSEESSKTTSDLERKLKTQERLAQLTQASENRLENNLTLDLADANIEEDRRDLITREIGKFREIMKEREECGVSYVEGAAWTDTPKHRRDTLVVD